MNFLVAFFIITALSLTGLPAHADDSGTDCWSPLITLPVDLGVFGPRSILTDFKVTDDGTYKPLILPVWVSMKPRVGQNSENDILSVTKIGKKEDDIDGSTDSSPSDMSPVYVLEVGKKNGEAAPIVASGSKTGDLSGEGKLTIRNVVDIFGKATTGKNFVATRTGADFQFIRIPIGKSGVTFVGVTRGAVEVQQSGPNLSGSLQPGGGFAFEIPTSTSGENLRIGVIGGPSFNIGYNAGSGNFITPAVSTGAQLLFF